MNSLPFPFVVVDDLCFSIIYGFFFHLRQVPSPCFGGDLFLPNVACQQVAPFFLVRRWVFSIPLQVIFSRRFAEQFLSSELPVASPAGCFVGRVFDVYIHFLFPSLFPRPPYLLFQRPKHGTSIRPHPLCTQLHYSPQRSFLAISCVTVPCFPAPALCWFLEVPT